MSNQIWHNFPLISPSFEKVEKMSNARLNARFSVVGLPYYGKESSRNIDIFIANVTKEILKALPRLFEAIVRCYPPSPPLYSYYGLIGRYVMYAANSAELFSLYCAANSAELYSLLQKYIAKLLPHQM